MADEKILIDLQVQIDQSLQEVKQFVKTANDGLDSVTKNTNKMNLAFVSFAANLAANLGTRVISTAFNLIHSTVSQAVDDFFELSYAIGEVNSIMPKNAKVTEEMRQQFVLLSSAYGGKSADQAKAYYEILQAGVTETTAAMNLLNIANKAAIAGQTDVQTAINGLVSALAVYAKTGLTAAEASDVLFKASVEGKTSFADLANVISIVTPIAGAAGISFEDMTGTLGYMTNVMPDASSAATSLRAILVELLKPTEEMRKAGRELGIDLSLSAVKSKGLAAFMDELKEKTGGSVEQLSRMFPSARALSGVLAILGGDVSNFSQMLDNVNKSSGATSEAFRKIEESAQFQFTTLKRELENLPQLFMTASEVDMAQLFKDLRVAVRDSIPALAEFTVMLVQASMFAVAMGEAVLSLIEKVRGLPQALTDAIVRNPFKAIEEGATESAKSSENSFTKFKDSLINIMGSVQRTAEGVGEKAKAGMLTLGTAGDQTAVAFSKVNQVVDETAAKTSTMSAEAKKLLDFAAQMGSSDVLAEKLNEQMAMLNEARAQNLLTDEEFAISKESLEAQSYNNRIALQQKNIQAMLNQQKTANNLSLQDQIKFLENEKARHRESADYQIAVEKELNVVRAQLRKEEIKDRDLFLSTVATMSRSSNKTLAMIGKAAAITQIAIKTPEAVASSFAFGSRIGGPILGFVFAAIAATAMAAQAAEVAGVPVATGMTEVPKGYPNDTFAARLTSGERVLNVEQNKDLKDFMAEGDQGGFNERVAESIDQLVIEIRDIKTKMNDITVNTIVEIDGREVVRAVNDQVNAGRRLVS